MRSDPARSTRTTERSTEGNCWDPRFTNVALPCCSRSSTATYIVYSTSSSSPLYVYMHTVTACLFLPTFHLQCCPRRQRCPVTATEPVVCGRSLNIIQCQRFWSLSCIAVDRLPPDMAVQQWVGILPSGGLGLVVLVSSSCCWQPLGLLAVRRSLEMNNRPSRH